MAFIENGDVTKLVSSVILAFTVPVDPRQQVFHEKVLCCPGQAVEFEDYVSLQ